MASRSGGSAKPITDSVIAIHTGYLFGNTSAVRTDAGLVLVDTGSRETASQTFAALRRWDDSPVHTVIYTHGHIDHCWGARLLDQEADAREIARPRIVAHRNVHNRFDRYDATHELNSLVMGRQFNQPGYTLPEGASPPRPGLRRSSRPDGRRRADRVVSRAQAIENLCKSIRWRPNARCAPSSRPPISCASPTATTMPCRHWGGIVRENGLPVRRGSA